MAQITIHQLAISNLGPFREQQVFPLAPTDGRPIILLTALNGSGKTTFLTALQLILYGQAGIAPVRSRPAYEALMRGLARNDATGPMVIEADLLAKLAPDDIAHLRLRREWTVTSQAVTERLTIFVNDEPNAEWTAGWSEFIDELLPSELLELFFFDGEKIEALASPVRLPELLRRALENYFGLSAIDSLSTSLRNVERRILQSRQSDTETLDLDELELQSKRLEEDIGRLTQESAAHRSALDQATKELDDYTNRARREGLDNYTQADNLRNDLLAKRQRVQSVIEVINDALSDPLLPLIWLGAQWEAYTEDWLADRQRHAVKEFVAELRARDKRLLAKVSRDVSKSALDLITKVFEQDAKELVSKARGKARYLISEDPTQITEALGHKVTNLRSLLQQLAKARTSLEKAEAQVRAIPERDQLGAVISALRDLSNKRSAIEHQLGVAEAAEAAARTQLQDVRQQLDTRLAAVRKSHFDSQISTKAAESSEVARDILAKFKQRLIESKIKWLSVRIGEEFHRLARKNRLVSEVHIDPTTFEVQITNSRGAKLPLERLSAGERQLFATAVLSALIRERKSPLPVAVDTPLARLDIPHRLKLIDGFFATVSHQIIVLSTDAEVTGETYSGMRRHIARELTMRFSDTTNSSEVEEVGASPLREAVAA